MGIFIIIVIMLAIFWGLYGVVAVKTEEEKNNEDIEQQEFIKNYQKCCKTP